MDRVSAKVRELSPDIVMLQEVWLGSHLRSSRHGSATRLDCLYMSSAVPVVLGADY